MQGAGEAARACADDQDVGFELFALDVAGVGHGAILAEEENGKEKMENCGAAGATLPEIVEFGDFGCSFAARRLRAEGVQKYCIEISVADYAGFEFFGDREKTPKVLNRNSDFGGRGARRDVAITVQTGKIRGEIGHGGRIVKNIHELR